MWSTFLKSFSLRCQSCVFTRNSITHFYFIFIQNIRFNPVYGTTYEVLALSFNLPTHNSLKPIGVAIYSIGILQ